MTDFLIEADYILTLAGAGMSADSGLSTYETMPEEYRELCNPMAFLQETARFQQFWCSFSKKYQSCEPHEGYRILQRWYGDETKKKLPNVLSYWVYTSNVDGHFRKILPEDRICEIHGFAGEWRCPHSMGYLPDGREKRNGPLWEQWNGSAETLDHSRCSKWDVTEDGEVTLSCPNCGLPGRPNVLLFHDTDSNVLGPINAKRQAYQTWEAEMENMVVYGNKTLVILELGCGRNVPALRIESEEVLRDCLERNPKASVVLVRVNPRDADADDQTLKDHVLPIPCSAMTALQTCDETIDLRMAQK
eukprot:scaffold4140_cov149-Amphora_coffeaeformis.AAC.2